MSLPATPPSETVYFALTGDLVASRTLEDRAAVQRTLRAAVTDLNAAFADDLAVPLKLIAGDEIQGLFARPAAAADVVVRMADELHPVAVMWGLGRGTLATDLADDVSMVDGPCLHRAREALEDAVRAGRWLGAAGIPPPHGQVLSALFRTTWALRSGWTDTQIKYVRAVRSRNQTEVAEMFGVSKQAVSKVLDAAGFAAVHEAEEAARALLSWLDRQEGDGG